MNVRQGTSLLTDQDVYLFNEGTHSRLYERLGAHVSEVDGTAGTAFAVWAPNAHYVSVLGDFNGWDPGAHPMHARGSSGIWETFVPEVGTGSIYKYHVASHHGGYRTDRADPFAVCSEVPPRTGSVVWDLSYEWHDEEWMRTRGERASLHRPISIYEVHLGSWRRVPEEGNRSLTYRELAQQLVEYVSYLGYTHVELLPVMEHPFGGSWGYQTTGYFAPTSRFGTPQDLMALIDALHQAGIGVILDWVPSHFPVDEHALARFDGTHLYEHADPRQGYHPDWGSSIFNYGRNEVRSFLTSSAHFWLDRYHADGLRVDAVASMLYLDYSRKDGEWVPNQYGGRENLEAVSFLRALNESVYARFPDVHTIAEESTSWPSVSRPTHLGGLGFGMKWDMGWMHDTLRYMSKDPVYRRYQHNDLTFRMLYAFWENFVLPLSHDEVVHGKGSLLNKMPGDEWQKFANLRELYGYMYAQPGKKLLFMGGEFGQWREWGHDDSLDWHLTHDDLHAGLMRMTRDLNLLYRAQPALHAREFDSSAFEWIDCCDVENSVVSLIRHGHHPDEDVVVVCNFTPVPRYGYRIGVPAAGYWKELLNSDSTHYGGSGIGNYGGVWTQDHDAHGRPYSLVIDLPPLAAVYFRRET